jgi:hypothetical protein
MNIGMLWFDNDPKANLDTKIERAALYYAKKYGKSPTLCFVHPSMLVNPAPDSERAGNEGPNGQNPAKNLFSTCGVEVRSNRSVLPNHFWIGVNGVSDAPTAA